MLMKLNRPSRQRGIGLLELMLSLAIIAILLVMATRYYTTAKTEREVNDGVALIEAIRGASAHWQGGKPNYQGLDMRQLADYGLLPKDVVGNNPSNPGQGANPWGGNVNVTPNGSNNGQIAITLSSVPREACLNMGGKLANQAQSVTQSCAANGDFTAIF